MNAYCGLTSTSLTVGLTWKTRHPTSQKTFQAMCPATARCASCCPTSRPADSMVWAASLAPTRKQTSIVFKNDQNGLRASKSQKLQFEDQNDHTWRITNDNFNLCRFGSIGYNCYSMIELQMFTLVWWIRCQRLGSNQVLVTSVLHPIH